MQRLDWSSPARGVVLGALLLVTALTVGDLLEGPQPHVVATVAVAPMLSAVFASPRAVAAVSAYTMIVTVVHSMVGGFAGTVPQAVRLVSIALASLLAVAVAVERRRQERASIELTRWRAIAGTSQRAILRELPGVVGDVEVSVRYISAYSPAKVGGDFYDVLETPFGVRAVMGDVRGKGLEAVRLAAQCLGCFRESVHRDADLGDVMRALDAAVRRASGEEDFVTAVLLELPTDARQLVVVNAGHPPPLLFDGSGLLELAHDGARPLGLRTRPAAARWDLPEDARVLLYTDGVTEARRGGDFFPFQGAVLAAADETATMSGWVGGISRRLEVFTGDRFEDDVALLALAPSAPPACTAR